MLDEPIAMAFDIAGAAEDAVWSEGERTVQVIYNEPGSEIFLGDASVRTTAPSCLVMAAQVPGIAAGQTLEIRGDEMVIRDIAPDGHGVLDLRLEAP